jgi:hypothetical protein
MCKVGKLLGGFYHGVGAGSLPRLPSPFSSNGDAVSHIAVFPHIGCRYPIYNSCFLLYLSQKVIREA